MFYDPKWDKPRTSRRTRRKTRRDRLLLEAADNMRKRGWCPQHGNGDGRLCLLDALHGQKGVYGEVEFATALGKVQTMTGRLSLVRWNNVATEKEALAVLEGAARG